MRALRIERFGDRKDLLELVDLLQPPLRPGDVRVSIQAAGINSRPGIGRVGLCSEVIDFDRDHTTLESLVMRAVSRFFKTEQSLNDLNLEHARHGAGLLAVRCSDENQKDNVWQISKEGAPLDARYYGFGAIDHLAGDPDTD